MSNRVSRVEKHEPQLPVAEPRGAFWPLMALLLVAALTLVALQMRRPRLPDPFEGLPLPPLDVAGWLNTDRPLSAADLRGNVVLIDFWASDCGPCLRHMPELVKYRQRFAERGVMVVGLTHEPPQALERVRRTVQRMGIDWPIGYGADLAYAALEIRGTPTYVLYDRSGRSVWSSHRLDGLEDATVAALARKAGTTVETSSKSSLTR